MSLELEKRIKKIKRVLNVERILSLSPDKSSIQKYYKINKIPYTVFHTGSDRIYMGISSDGIYKEDDLLGDARIVEEYILNRKAKTILELATGRGANSYYLAKQFPHCKFLGLDISDAQLSLATKKAKKVSNYFPELGDYHDLSRFKDESVDIVFVVEALCYSTEKEKVLHEVCRVLKPDGLFVVFDGYLNKSSESLSAIEKISCGLVEKGMALVNFESYKSFIEKAKSDFQVYKEEDLSKFVLPTMSRFENMSARFFGYPNLAGIVSKILPTEFINNSVAGYLMAPLVREGIYCYMLTILSK